ncbi:MAG: inositol monophosphatase family protein [Actinomycetota bacterium]
MDGRLGLKPLADSQASLRLEWAAETATEAGKLLLGRFRSGLKAEEKESGIVTALDREAEELIASRLAKTFPEDGLLSEEGAARPSTSGWKWIVDPLDGTTNYVTGLPFFGTSMACFDDEGAALGVVHAPAFDETFTSLAGMGAMGPTGPLATSKAKTLKKSVFLVNKAYYPPDLVWKAAGGLLNSIRAFRVLGCVSLDLVQVAAGRVDGIVLFPSPSWDLAAGVAILQEAGAAVGFLGWETEGRLKVLDADPGPAERTGIIACPPSIFSVAVAALG